MVQIHAWDDKFPARDRFLDRAVVPLNVTIKVFHVGATDGEMRISVVTIQTLERVNIILDQSFLVCTIDKVVLVQGIRHLILAKTKDGIDIAVWLESGRPNARTIIFNSVYIDELLLIHADCGVYITITKAPRIFNLVARPLEANAIELLRHSQVGESLRIGWIEKRSCIFPTNPIVLEGRADRSGCVKDASTYPVKHCVGTRISATDLTRHGVHIVV